MSQTHTVKRRRHLSSRVEGFKGHCNALNSKKTCIHSFVLSQNALDMQTVWRVWFQCHPSTSWSQDPSTRVENHDKMVRTLCRAAYSQHPSNQPGTDMPDTSVKELLITTFLRKSQAGCVATGCYCPLQCSSDNGEAFRAAADARPSL